MPYLRKQGNSSGSTVLRAKIISTVENEIDGGRKPLNRIVNALVNCRLDIAIGFADLRNLCHFPTGGNGSGLTSTVSAKFTDDI